VFTDHGGVRRKSNWRAGVRASGRAVPEGRRLLPVDNPSITPHDLRHTAASLAVSAGANVKAVQRMLGHAKAMTLDVYAILFDQDLGSVAANLDAAIRSTAYRLRTGQS
jgi:integrase